MHVINNAHIYENQIEGIEQQLFNFSEMDTFENYPKVLFESDKLRSEEQKNKIRDSVNYIPQLIIDKTLKDFKDFNANNISLNGYSVKYGNMGKVEMPVSV